MFISNEDSKSVVRRYFEAGDRDDLGAWDELCSPNMTLHAGFIPPIEGLEAVRQLTARMHAAFSDFSLSIEDMVAEGDRVAVRHTTQGTHTSPLLSPGGVIPATGKRMAMTGISFMRVADGKIIEERTVADLLGGMQQLGVIPSPA